MIDVFLSRPTWVSGDFQPGLDNFLKFLKGHDCNPRTIGKSDFPNKSPLDEVIAVMEACKGVIVLGYPQLIVVKGSVKNEQIPSKKNPQLLLATEWNHIEASLAYAKGLPLLIIHQVGISRGVFDRGAGNAFLYEVDLSLPSWPLTDQVSGAFDNWKQRVLKLNTIERPTRALTNQQSPQFVSAHGVLWKRTSSGIEPLAYCPECLLAMSSWPPESDELLICSKCDFTAPFKPSEVKSKSQFIK